MAVEKTLIFTAEDPETKESRTIMMQRFVDEELIPKFDIAAIDGAYKTRTQFVRAYEGNQENIDLITFYGGDFRLFIEKCIVLEDAKK